MQTHFDLRIPSDEEVCQRMKFLEQKAHLYGHETEGPQEISELIEKNLTNRDIEQIARTESIHSGAQETSQVRSPRAELRFMPNTRYFSSLIKLHNVKTQWHYKASSWGQTATKFVDNFRAARLPIPSASFVPYAR